MIRYLLAALLALAAIAPAALAQDGDDDTLRLATVTRPPFSLSENGLDTGFTLDLWDALMQDIGRDYVVQRTETFGEMLDLVRRAEVDAAAANISITADRETEMDFTQPIFSAGLQIMVPASDTVASPFLSRLVLRDFLIAVVAAFALLFAAGMLMWLFERRHQDYFRHDGRKALFPAFWWALNLIVNGGFEERQPRSAPGRVLGVVMVISSLFLVSIFVAKITTTMTVEAIQSAVSSVSDLYGKRVGTTGGSTAAAYLDRREIRYQGYDGFAPLIADFEAGALDAVVFDAPILAHYVTKAGAGTATLAGPVFLRENYGIALPTGSELHEPINQSLLRLRENGTYEEIRVKWFGPSDG
ncbi:transporter substrate-binding domain-containing protein [Maritimibacter fusiformis]|uniref:Transporter substrate-binding domain-containing protein n=1 Tax=Maritimibacter fusiformis TaxID=2603819 RepID=A0A5D0R829_9RHOB|nr:transporter substrate-binding domain-containing protein [Maritimibacter fusiformis]TYB77627.1 transporter substrate-binding domain-containing protein [Maritimibacter fusiformis]